LPIQFFQFGAGTGCDLIGKGFEYSGDELGVVAHASDSTPLTPAGEGNTTGSGMLETLLILFAVVYGLALLGRILEGY
jgi:hypothetical protein